MTTQSPVVTLRKTEEGYQLVHSSSGTHHFRAANPAEVETPDGWRTAGPNLWLFLHLDTTYADDPRIREMVLGAIESALAQESFYWLKGAMKWWQALIPHHLPPQSLRLTPWRRLYEKYSGSARGQVGRFLRWAEANPICALQRPALEQGTVGPVALGIALEECREALGCADKETMMDLLSAEGYALELDENNRLERVTLTPPTHPHWRGVQLMGRMPNELEHDLLGVRAKLRKSLNALHIPALQMQIDFRQGQSFRIRLGPSLPFSSI